jgi:hypothetical protein
MGYLADNTSLHYGLDMLGRVQPSWYQCASWVWIAELMRRHPGEIEVFEGVYPAGGTVWFLCRAKSDRERYDPFREVICRINEAGHVDQKHSHQGRGCPVEDGLSAGDDSRFNNLEILFSRTRRAMIRELEECMGLGAVRSTPSTLASTIGPRLIASALSLFLHTKTPLEVRGALYDGVHPLGELTAFPQLTHLSVPDAQFKETVRDLGYSDEAHKQLATLFFLNDIRTGSAEVEEEWAPVAAIDIARGTMFLARSSLNMMQEYVRWEKDIDQMAFHLVTQARRERN